MGACVVLSAGVVCAVVVAVVWIGALVATAEGAALGALDALVVGSTATAIAIDAAALAVAVAVVVVLVVALAAVDGASRCIAT